MTGDRHKPQGKAARAIEWSRDGRRKLRRVPSLHSDGKKANRRWRRRREKSEEPT